jgi:adenosine kinase
LLNGIENAKVLMVNDYEFEMIKNKTGLAETDLKRKVETIIVTQGEYGSMIYSEEREIKIPPAVPSRVADPTGVGDAYRAGIITGMMRGYPWEVTGRLASITAMYVLEQHGTQRHSYTRRQLANHYREVFGDPPELEDFVGYHKEK